MKMDRTAGEKIAYTSSFNFRDHLRYGYLIIVHACIDV